MDRSRYKRPVTKTQRQTVKQTFGIPQPVSKVLPARQQSGNPKNPVNYVRTQAIYPLTPRPHAKQSPVQTAKVSTSMLSNLKVLNTQSSQMLEPLAKQARQDRRVEAVPPLQPIVEAAPPIKPVAQIKPRPIVPLTLPRQETTVTVSEEPTSSTTISEPTSSSLMARQVAIDMDLPGEASQDKHESIFRRSKWQKLRLLTTRGLAIVLVLVMTLGGLLFSQSYLKLHKVFKGSSGVASALTTNLLNGESSGRVNILVMGRDGGNSNKADLTDSMMLVSIDTLNDTVTTLSIPTNLWVNVPGAGLHKINAAWEAGEFKYLGENTQISTSSSAVSAGFNLADQTVNQVLGVKVDYNVLVDMQAVQELVNELGGISVNVPTDLVDPTMAWENGGNATLAQAGTQNFNGKQTLLYATSRESTSDFASDARQRSVLLSIENKILSLGTLSNPIKISDLLNTLGNDVQTDMSINNASQLYGIIKNVSSNDINSIDLDGDNGTATSYVTTGNADGQSIVLPQTGLFNYSAIQQYVGTQLKNPYLVKENAKITILNGTITPGLATDESNILKSYGYNVVTVGNTPDTGWTQTTLIDLNHSDKYTNQLLEGRFKQKSLNSLPFSGIPTYGADFVIIIGSDETSSIQAQTN